MGNKGRSRSLLSRILGEKEKDAHVVGSPLSELNETDDESRPGDMSGDESGKERTKRKGGKQKSAVAIELYFRFVSSAFSRLDYCTHLRVFLSSQ